MRGMFLLVRGAQCLALLLMLVFVFGCDDQSGTSNHCQRYCKRVGNVIYEYHYVDSDNDPETPCESEFIRSYSWDSELEQYISDDGDWMTEQDSQDPLNWRVFRDIGGYWTWQYDIFEEVKSAFSQDEHLGATAWSCIGDQLSAISSFLESDGDYGFDVALGEALSDGLAFDTGAGSNSESTLLEFWHSSYASVTGISAPSGACTAFKADILSYYLDIARGEHHTFFEDFTVTTQVLGSQLRFSITDDTTQLFLVTITKSGNNVTSVYGTCEGEQLSADQQAHPILVYNAVLADTLVKPDPDL